MTTPPLKVLYPANVCAPVVTIPEAETDALGIAGKVTAGWLPLKVPVGPAVVPFVQANVVCAVFVLVKD